MRLACHSAVSMPRSTMCAAMAARQPPIFPGCRPCEADDNQRSPAAPLVPAAPSHGGIQRHAAESQPCQPPRQGGGCPHIALQSFYIVMCVRAATWQVQSSMHGSVGRWPHGTTALSQYVEFQHGRRRAAVRGGMVLHSVPVAGPLQAGHWRAAAAAGLPVVNRVWADGCKEHAHCASLLACWLPLACHKPARRGKHACLNRNADQPLCFSHLQWPPQLALFEHSAS